VDWIHLALDRVRRRALVNSDFMKDGRSLDDFKRTSGLLKAFDFFELGFQSLRWVRK
jgi:hypothetical protein